MPAVWIYIYVYVYIWFILCCLKTCRYTRQSLHGKLHDIVQFDLLMKDELILDDLAYSSPG